MFSRGSFESKVVSRRRRRALKIKLLAAFIFLIILATGLVFVSRLKEIQIENIYVKGNSFVSEGEILKVANDVLSGYTLFVFPNRNIFYYPRRTIEDKLVSSYSEIKDSKVSFKDFNSIDIFVSERKERALWCETDDGEEEVCYLVDEGGIIFRKAENYSGDAYVRFTGGISGNPTGMSFMPQDEFKETSIFTDSLLKDGLAVSSVLIREDGVREGNFFVGGKIIWNADQDLSLALLNLRSLVENENFKGKTKDGVISVEYIDIQNSNKIFYKVR